MKKLVIVGGGTAGCIVAAALAKQLNPALYDITVLESSHVEGIGVGESVLPSFLSFLQKFGLDEQGVIEKIGAGIKLGTQFRDWNGNDDSFFHQLGDLGCELNGYDFYNCWLKARSEGDPTPLRDYAPAAVMANSLQFDFPSRLPSDSPLAGANYALHLEVEMVCRYLRDFAKQREVRFIKAHVVRFKLGETGFIKSLELNNHTTIEGDFFIDCSGLRGLLIHEALNSGYESWKQFLPCDRAVVMHAPNQGVIPLHTTSTARECGWTWCVPLKNHMSHGYVFSSEHSSDRHAVNVLLDSFDGEPLHDPYFVPFRNGMREQLWKKNCIALGLAGGFLEPLESTAIHLVIRGVESMLALFPNFDEGVHEWPDLASEYNRRMRVEYQEIRDFIILHYLTSNRTDTEFWRCCQSLSVPDGLAAKVELFRSRAELQVAEGSLFKESSWQAVLTGMGVVPHAWHPFVDMADFAAIHQLMLAQSTRLKAAVQDLPPIEEFLKVT